jgi:DNA-binding response OmpR family regulator
MPMDTILVVEDEQLFLAQVRNALEQASFAVRAVDSPTAALQVLEREAVHAILLDAVMQEVDGLGLLSKMRTLYPDIPAVVMSGRGSPRTEQEARRLGAAEVLPKPLNVEDLVRVLKGAIGQARSQPPERAQLPQLRRLQQCALELADMMRWDQMGEFLRNNATLFQRVIELIADAIQVDIVSLMLVNEAEGTLRIAHAKGLELNVQREAVRAVGEGIAGHVAKTGEPLLIRDLSLDPVHGKGILNPRYRTNSVISVPVKISGKTVGVLNANNKINGTPFDDNDLALFTTFSCLVSLSFATTQLFDRLASSVDELAKTNARLVRTNADLEAKLRELQRLRGQAQS